MKISLKWINDFIDVSEYFNTPQVLADILTKAGFEVEEIQNRASDFKNVVVGQIKVKDKHPNADKLSLCQVDVGGGKTEQIVCGAQNHKVGDKVIVALPGAILPGNFAIKNSKIRDVESNGMLCSLKELGLAETSDGLFILDAGAPVGKAYAEFGGFDDVTFELKVTPNRADCLSHFGLARELGCLLNKPVKSAEVLSKFVSPSTQSKIKLEVIDSDLCPRYTGRYIAGVKIGPSPDWLKKRLELVGLNSINNVVDVTNYVMLEMGQPLHAFDADLIKGAQIKVRRAHKGETFQTLTAKDLTMSGYELVICDSEKILALGGVIGGLNSGVSEKTQNIFLESASFNAMSVRKSSRSHGIETDSAYRFSRGVDQSNAMHISNRAALLIQQVAGGEVYDQAYDFYPVPMSKNPIRISLKTVAARLGYPVDEKLFLNYMKGLQIEVEEATTGDFLMTPPLFRFDIEQDMDLVEEYARLHGYEHIQETIPALKIGPLSHDAKYMMNLKVTKTLCSDGFNQAFNYAFTNEKFENNFLKSPGQFKELGLRIDASSVKIKNPLSEELNVMRRSLVPGLWKNAVENIRAGNQEGSLFEIGPVFSKEESKYIESIRLSIISWGEGIGVFASNAPQIYQIKSAVEKLFQSLQVTAYTFVQTAQTAAPAFIHAGQWASVVVEGQTLGFIGTAHPGWLSDEKIRLPMAVAELDLDQILKGQPRSIKFKSLSKFQPVERDFAFVMDSNQAVGDLLKEAKKSCGALLKDCSVFDIYEGDKLPAGQKSVALRATFQNSEKALAEADLQTLSEKVIEAAQKSVKAVLR